MLKILMSYVINFKMNFVSHLLVSTGRYSFMFRNSDVISDISSVVTICKHIFFTVN